MINLNKIYSHIQSYLLYFTVFTPILSKLRDTCAGFSAFVVLLPLVSALLCHLLPRPRTGIRIHHLYLWVVSGVFLFVHLWNHGRCSTQTAWRCASLCLWGKGSRSGGLAGAHGAEERRCHGLLRVCLRRTVGSSMDPEDAHNFVDVGNSCSELAGIDQSLCLFALHGRSNQLRWWDERNLRSEWGKRL